jgi:hypothetical protein
VTTDREAQYYLAGFCSSTAEFNGDTHGNTLERQDWGQHADNLDQWADEIDPQ